MLPLALVAGLLLAAVAVLLFQGVALYLAARMPRLDPAAPTPGARSWPQLSVIIAARNEEEDLPGCLDDLLAQEYPGLEVIVVDGGSEDRTREVARQRSPGVRLIEEPPLPAGWVGKNWACDVGYRASTGEILLFTDADVRYHPATLRTVVAWAERERADLATLAPRVTTVGFWERVVMPFYVQVVLTYFRVPRTNVDTSRTAMANGQFWLTSRARYESTGGHAAVRGYVLEDIRIAQRYRAAGLRLRVAWAPGLVSTRMYRDRHEMFEGLLKNIHGTEFSAARQTGFLVALLGLYWLPLALLPFGLLVGSWALAGMGAFLWFALFGKHVVLAGATGTSAAYGLLFPLAVAFYAALLATSIRSGGGRGAVAWKGREYPVRPPAPPPAERS
jgi:glycosyltransferase involved in cell wall biosynthesis